MQKDYSINKELQILFKNYKDSRQNNLTFDYDVTVIAKGFWPSTIIEEEAVIIPPELKPAINFFEDFYSKNNQNRKLTWLFGQGNCQLSASTSFFDKKYQFIVNNYQLLIFLIFNNPRKEPYTVDEVRIMTEIPMNELEAALNPLIRHKIVILKYPDGSEIKINPQEKVIPFFII